jgi:propanol-preferring alcohol dehydrogenase
MKSCQIVDHGKPLELRAYPDPEPVGTEVLLRVTACGVCHTDLHLWHGFFDLGDGQQVTLASRGVELPFTMGHEIVGEVVALGPEATGAAVGDRRVAFPWIGCGTCPACQHGDEVHCASPWPLGTRRPGGYSDRVLVPHPRYLVDYGEIDEALACTYACSGLTAFSALRKLPALGPEDTVLTIGVGGVGINALNIAPAVTGARILAADIDPTKRAHAARHPGVRTIDNGRPDAVAEVVEATGGGAAAAIDFVGRAETAQFGLDCLRRGGTLVIVGLYGGKWPLSVALLPLRSATVRGSFVGSLAELTELMALVRTGRIPPLPVNTRPLAEATEALRGLEAGTVVGRTVLRP